MIKHFEPPPKQYRTLLARTSCRRFDSAPLDETALQSVHLALDSVEPIQAEHRVKFLTLNELEKSQLAVAQGAYGRFIVSSHLMIPYTEKSSDSLIELGFQSQQAVIKLEEMGLGSCYVGAHSRVRKLQQEFGLAETAHLAAVLIYGKPAPPQQKKHITQSLLGLTGNRTRKPVENLFIEPIPLDMHLPAEWEAILEGGRWAPSATNAQPWRLLPIDGEFQLFTNPAAYPIVLNAGSKLMYALYDAGIFMANILLAARAFGVQAHWTLQHQTRVPNQKSLIPIARLSFS
jgi:nitroreductase